MSGLEKWFKRQKRTLEDQPWWGGVEFVLHVLLAAVPAFLAIHWLPLDFGWKMGIALAVAGIGQPYGWSWGLAREIKQNWGDPPDRTTLFVVPFTRLPVNVDMGVDMLGYLVGGVIAGVASSFL